MSLCAFSCLLVQLLCFDTFGLVWFRLYVLLGLGSFLTALKEPKSKKKMLAGGHVGLKITPKALLFIGQKCIIIKGKQCSTKWH